MASAYCKGCGKPIEWIEFIEGIGSDAKIKRIPIDTRAPTYEFIDGKWRRSSASVSHFATCPNANDFSKKSSEPKTDRPKEWYEKD